MSPHWLKLSTLYSPRRDKHITLFRTAWRDDYWKLRSPTLVERIREISRADKSHGAFPVQWRTSGAPVQAWNPRAQWWLRGQKPANTMNIYPRRRACCTSLSYVSPSPPTDDFSPRTASSPFPRDFSARPSPSSAYCLAAMIIYSRPKNLLREPQKREI